jgi:hypothetical protein
VSIDWVIDDMAKQIFGDVASQGKVPRDDPGMIVIENGVRATMRRAVSRTIAAADPAPKVEVPLVAEMADLLPRGVRASFEFKLAGAVHTVDPVTGVVVL